MQVLTLAADLLKPSALYQAGNVGQFANKHDTVECCISRINNIFVKWSNQFNSDR